MSDPQPLAKLFIGIGVVFILIGMIFFVLPKMPWLGRLPGDIHIEREGFRMDFPVTTCLLLSLLLSLFFWVAGRHRP